MGPLANAAGFRIALAMIAAPAVIYALFGLLIRRRTGEGDVQPNPIVLLQPSASAVRRTLVKSLGRLSPPTEGGPVCVCRRDISNGFGTANAISPVVLISGVGLLLLTMTNRLGRIVDRARSSPFACAVQTGKTESRSTPNSTSSRRGRVWCAGLSLCSFCVLFASLLVISLFITSLAGAEIPWLVAGLFILSLLSLIASLVEFIRDVNRSLEATALEVGTDWHKE